MSKVALPPLQMPDSKRYTQEDRSPRSHHAPQSHEVTMRTGSEPSSPTAASGHPNTETQQPKLHAKQSLPSLSEALGVEAPTPSHPSSATTSGPVSAPPPRAHHPSSLDTSPTRIARPSSRHQYHPYHHESSRQQGYSSDSREYRRNEPLHYGSRGHSPPYANGSRTGYPQDQANVQVYQPSVAHPPPPPPPGPQHRSVWNGRPEVDPRSPNDMPYGESVNRHLSIFDFNHALQEIVDQTNVISNFGQVYSARLHQSQRTGFVSGMLPAITEIDDLVNRSRRTLFALTKARNVLVAQQAMHAEAQQDDRMVIDPNRPRQDSLSDGVDPKSDVKKRKGRAAPPGRCHSCNRADTPEWRRGPDGARTLCNACGLHYAKLTRKAGGVTKANLGNSSLRTAETVTS